MIPQTVRVGQIPVWMALMVASLCASSRVAAVEIEAQLDPVVPRVMIQVPYGNVHSIFVPPWLAVDRSEEMYSFPSPALTGFQRVLIWDWPFVGDGYYQTDAEVGPYTGHSDTSGVIADAVAIGRFYIADNFPQSSCVTTAMLQVHASVSAGMGVPPVPQSVDGFYDFEITDGSGVPFEGDEGMYSGYVREVDAGQNYAIFDEGDAWLAFLHGGLMGSARSYATGSTAVRNGADGWLDMTTRVGSVPRGSNLQLGINTTDANGGYFNVRPELRVMFTVGHPEMHVISMTPTGNLKMRLVATVHVDESFFRPCAGPLPIVGWRVGSGGLYVPVYSASPTSPDVLQRGNVGAWRVVSGPGALLQSTPVSNPGVQQSYDMEFSAYGDYVLACTVSDALGAVNAATNTVSLTVSPPVDVQVHLSADRPSPIRGDTVRCATYVTALFGAERFPYGGVPVTLSVLSGSIHAGLISQAHTQSTVTDLGGIGVAVFDFRGDGQMGEDHLQATCLGVVSNSIHLKWIDSTGEDQDGVGDETGITECPLPPAQITNLTSRVENPQLSHIHTATDYSVGSSAGCSSCGGSGASSSGLVTDLRLDRIHRYVDQSRPGSFGPGVFANVDISLALWDHGAAGEIWDPAASGPISLTPDVSGVFTDPEHAAIKRLRLLAADGSPVTTVDAAVTAVADLRDGGTWTFEMVQTQAGGADDVQGRLIAIADRIGNRLSIAYAFSAQATTADMSGSRARLMEMSNVVDQRGRTLTFAYGWACGQPVVTDVAYPSGEHVVYRYDGDIAGLGSIDFPDGTHSTFATRLDEASQTQAIAFHDAGAEGVHRTKDIYLTLIDWQPADGAQPRRAQDCNRVRRVIGPTGELMYMSWVKRVGEQIQITVYEGGGSAGGGRVRRLDTIDGMPQATWVGSSWSLQTSPSTWTWEKDADYQSDAMARMGSQTDAIGRTKQYSRDAVSGAITGRTHLSAAGVVVSRETTQYNGYRQPTWHVDANNIGTRSVYDEHGNLLSRTEGIRVAEDGVTEDASHATTSQWTYRSDGQVLTETDSLGNTTTYEYDARAFRTAEISPPDDPAFPDMRARKTWHFDAAGRLDVSTDAAGHSTSYIYDSRNRVTAIRYGNGSQETMVYGTGTDASLLISKTDRDGVVTVFGYDAAGREISRTEGAQDPLAAIATTTTYLEGTDLPETVMRAGQMTYYIYDKRKRVIYTMRWANGGQYQTETTVYDAADRVAYTQETFGRRTYFVYDDLDRVVRTIRESVVGGVPGNADLVSLYRISGGNPAYVIEETAYDVGGRVLATTDACGIVTRMGYDSQGRVTDRWDAFGTAEERHWQTRYDAVGNRVVEIDPLGHETRFTYTGRNLVASQTIAFGTSDAATTHFTYTPTGQRATQTDPNGHTTQWTYGHCCDWLKDVTDPAGFVTSYTYTLGGKVATVTDPNGHVTITHYDALGRPFEQIDGRGASTQTCFDEDLTDGIGLDAMYAAEIALIADRAGMHAVAVSNPLGETTVRISDSLGRPALAINQDRQVTQTIQDVQVQVDGSMLVGSVVVDPLGNQTGQYADGLGRVRVVELPTASQIPPVGETYDTNLLDGEGIDAEYDLGYLGDISMATATKIVDVSGSTSVVVDGISFVNSTSMGPYGGMGGDGEQHQSTDWDLMDGLGVDADYLAELELYGFMDRTGMWADMVIEGDGWVYLTVYQKTTTSVVIGPFAPLSISGCITMSYDANGNRLSVTDALGHATVSSFDLHNRQVTITDAAGNTTGVAFDAVGNVVTATDGFGHSTTFTYTARNQKKTEKDRLDHSTVFTYDLAGNLATITDAEAGVTAYTYTERNQLLTETFPGTTGGTRTYGYWPNGQLKTRLDQRGITTTYLYDLANRLTDRTYSDGTADHFVLDDAGRITSATASRSGVVVARQYFPTGLIKEEQTTWPLGIDGVPTAMTVTYQYDATGKETALTLPDGRMVNRTYNARNELQTLMVDGRIVATLGHDNGGRLTSTAFANGLTDVRTYTANNLLESTVVASGWEYPSLNLTYAYDANKRKTDEINLDPSKTQHFGYDLNDRLTSWSTMASPKMPASQIWNLSAVGDWTQNTVDGVTENRTHTAVHEIKTSNGLALSYDAAGNLSRTESGQTFTWDAENRLLAADVLPNFDGVADRAVYLTDAFGRRVGKSVFGSTTLYVHDGWQVVQEIEGPTSLPVSAAADDGSLAGLAHTPAGAILPTTYDAQGNPQYPTRINYQPGTTPIPPGWIVDTSKDFAVRSNGLTYGWVALQGEPPRGDPVINHFMPLPQYDTYTPLGDPQEWTWQIALPPGSYPVVLVLGDPVGVRHTFNVTVQGEAFDDPHPYDPEASPGYERGRFVGVSKQVTVGADGLLSIQAAAGAYKPTLCFIEIGAQGTLLTADIQQKLADEVSRASARTGGLPFWNGGRSETRSYIWGAGIDELIGYQRTKDYWTQTYYVHTGAQWSVMAITDSDRGQVEQSRYTAYGKRVLDYGDSNERSIIGLTTGFTGRALDEETGLMYFRNRMYQPQTGVFVSRDPMGYVDGQSLYRAYFVPRGMDPMGTEYDPAGLTDHELLSLWATLDTALNNIIHAWGASANGYGQSFRFLQRYIDKWGDQTMPYSFISDQDVMPKHNEWAIKTACANKSLKLFKDKNGITGFVGDPKKSLGSVAVSYEVVKTADFTSMSGGCASLAEVKAKIHDYYDFNPNRDSGQGGSGGLNIDIPHLNELGKAAVWGWFGGNIIRDTWLYQLAQKDKAKSFYTDMEWTIRGTVIDGKVTAEAK